MSLDSCRTIEFPTRVDARGTLTFAEEGAQFPFAVRRIYYLYGSSAADTRGRHAHRRLEQMFVAIHGSFRIVLDDGDRRASFPMAEPNRALYVGPMLWRELDQFSRDAVCLVLASHLFDERDYIRDYDEFCRSLRNSS